MVFLICLHLVLRENQLCWKSSNGLRSFRWEGPSYLCSIYVIIIVGCQDISCSIICCGISKNENQMDFLHSFWKTTHTSQLREYTWKRDYSNCCRLYLVDAKEWKIHSDSCPLHWLLEILPSLSYIYVFLDYLSWPVILFIFRLDFPKYRFPKL